MLARLHAVHPGAEPYGVLLEHARERVRAAGGRDLADDVDVCYGEIFGLSLGQHVEWLSEAPAIGVASPGGTRAIALARRQAALGGSHVATLTHRSLSLDDFARELLTRLDGSRARAALVADMLDRFPGQGAIGGATGVAYRARVAANVDRLLALFGHHGLLG
jgi:hypothetical protein